MSSVGRTRVRGRAGGRFVQIRVRIVGSWIVRGGIVRGRIGRVRMRGLEWLAVVVRSSRRVAGGCVGEERGKVCFGVGNEWDASFLC